jgi:hypothetical protein
MKINFDQVSEQVQELTLERDKYKGQWKQAVAEVKALEQKQVQS